MDNTKRTGLMASWLAAGALLLGLATAWGQGTFSTNQPGNTLNVNSVDATISTHKDTANLADNLLQVINSHATEDMYIDSIINVITATHGRQYAALTVPTYGPKKENQVQVDATASDAFITVHNATKFPVGGVVTTQPQSMSFGQDTEKMLVLSQVDNTGTGNDQIEVQRGYLGTTAAPITAGTMIANVTKLSANGGSQNLPIHFQAFAPGTYQTTARVYSSAPGSPHDITLQATATGPTIEPEATAVFYDSTALGGTAVYHLRITNNGNQALSIDNVRVSHPSFFATDITTPATIGIGATSTFELSFTPKTTAVDAKGGEGWYRGYVFLEGNWGPNYGTAKIQLQGFGTSQPIGETKIHRGVTSQSLTLDIEGLTGWSGTTKRLYISGSPAAGPADPLPNQTLVQTLTSSSATLITQNNLAANTRFYIHLEGDLGPTQSRNTWVRTVGGMGGNVERPIDGLIRDVWPVAPNMVAVTLKDPMVHSHAMTPTAYGGNGFDRDTKQIIGDFGATYQAGTWQLHQLDANNVVVDVVAVTNVDRRSNPEGADYFYIHGFSGRNGDPVNGSTPNADGSKDHLHDLDHILFLTLDENLAAGTYRIEYVEGSLDVHWVWDDKYSETLTLKHNEVGFSARAAKRWAYITHWLGDGGGLSLAGFPASANIYLQGPDPNIPLVAHSTPTLSIVDRVVSDDGNSGGPIKEINLASLAENNTQAYRVVVPGVGVSRPVWISDVAVERGLYMLTRALYLNRNARVTTSATSMFGTWPADHTKISLTDRDWDSGTCKWFKSSSSACNSSAGTPDVSGWYYTYNEVPARLLTISGGHHDAGDFDIGPHHYRIGQMLLMAYENNPSMWTDGQFNIPESGNGIPDLLDEAYHNIKLWQELQVTSPDSANQGAIRVGFEGREHPKQFYYAHEDSSGQSSGAGPGDDTPGGRKYWTWKTDRYHTARAGALMAWLSRLIAPYDSGKASALADASALAYKYVEFLIDDANTPGDVLWISSARLALTDSVRYKTRFENTWAYWDAQGAAGNGIFNGAYKYDEWQRNQDVDEPLVTGGSNPDPVHQAEPEWIFNYTKAATADATIKNRILIEWQTEFQSDVNRTLNSAGIRSERVALGFGNSTGLLRSRHVDAFITAGSPTAQQQQDAIDAFSLGLDWILGGNETGVVYITGLGTRYPSFPLWNDGLAAYADGYGVIPGMPVYGPVKNYKTDLPAGFPYKLRFPESGAGWTGAATKYSDWYNDPDINEQDAPAVHSPLIRAFGFLMPTMATATPANWQPGGRSHLFTTLGAAPGEEQGGGGGGNPAPQPDAGDGSWWDWWDWDWNFF